MPTPINVVDDNLVAKLELFNPGGSHKYRAARQIIDNGLADGSIVSGRTTVIEKTGGNFGFALLAACKPLKIDVALAVGLSFSQRKRRLLDSFGAQMIGIPELEAGYSPKEIVHERLANALATGVDYFYTDQFNNPGSVQGHEQRAAPEFAAQLNAWADRPMVLVMGAGTGASFTGLTRGLKSAGLVIETVLVEPEGSNMRDEVFVDHRFEGISVGVVAPLLDWSLVDHVEHVSTGLMVQKQQEYFFKTGHFIGNTAAGCYAVAQRMAHSDSDRLYLVIACDSGLWYEDQLTMPELAGDYETA